MQRRHDPLASVGTATLVALNVALTPMFYYIPHAVLAAVIVVAVASLVDWRMPFRLVGFEQARCVRTGRHLCRRIFAGNRDRSSSRHGHVTGTVSLADQPAAHRRRWSVGNSESFRNVQRHEVTTYPTVLAIRVDESLYFANTKYLEDWLLDKVAEHRDVEHLLLVGSGINYVDATRWRHFVI